MPVLEIFTEPKGISGVESFLVGFSTAATFLRARAYSRWERDKTESLDGANLFAIVIGDVECLENFDQRRIQ